MIVESTKVRLEGELSGNKTNMAEVRRLEKEMTDLQDRLDEISSTMEKSTKELQKEQLKSRNASKHSQVRVIQGVQCRMVLMVIFLKLHVNVFWFVVATRCVRKVIGQGRHFVTFQSSCLIFWINIDQTLI